MWATGDRDTSLTAMTAPDLERLSGLLSATGPTTQVRSPLTGKIIATVPTSTADDIAAAAATARRANQGTRCRR